MIWRRPRLRSLPFWGMVRVGAASLEAMGAGMAGGVRGYISADLGRR